MANQELDDILASMQQIVREAYALGRSDALKQVVEVLKADTASPKPLALLGPADEAMPHAMPASTENVATQQDQEPPSPFKPSNDDRGAASGSPEATPWWARQPRSMW